MFLAGFSRTTGDGEPHRRIRDRLSPLSALPTETTVTLALSERERNYNPPLGKGAPPMRLSRVIRSSILGLLPASLGLAGLCLADTATSPPPQLTGEGAPNPFARHYQLPVIAVSPSIPETAFPVSPEAVRNWEYVLDTRMPELKPASDLLRRQGCAAIPSRFDDVEAAYFSLEKR
jgi:hypothetical protein